MVTRLRFQYLHEAGFCWVRGVSRTPQPIVRETPQKFVGAPSRPSLNYGGMVADNPKSDGTSMRRTRNGDLSIVRVASLAVSSVCTRPPPPLPSKNERQHASEAVRNKACDPVRHYVFHCRIPWSIIAPTCGSGRIGFRRWR